MAIDNGNTVSVHYTGKLEDGQVFDTSTGREPLTFEVGSGQLIPGFDAAVRGKEAGDVVTTTIEPEEGYGPHNPDMIQEMPRERIGGVELEVGQVLGLEDQEGRPFQATVAELNEETVKLDFNHFLAGKTLVFDIEIVAVE